MYRLAPLLLGLLVACSNQTTPSPEGAAALGTIGKPLPSAETPPPASPSPSTATTPTTPQAKPVTTAAPKPRRSRIITDHAERNSQVNQKMMN